MRNDKKSLALWARAKRWLWRTAFVLAGLLLFYGGFLLLGFVPANNGYAPPPADDRVRLFIRNNEIHTDIVMPVVDEESGIDWRELFPPAHFHADVRRDRYVAVGWGNRQFFVETPTWADLKISTAVGALCVPSESVLHVEYLHMVSPGETMREVFVTRQQYQELAQFVRASVGATDQQGAAVLATDKTYGEWDRFYVSSGRYHMFNTCNQWTGRGLKRAGVRVGIWTPLITHVLFWLPPQEGATGSRKSAR